MTQSHQEIAETIVERFRAGLSASARQHIDDAQFAGLATHIQAALGAEQAVAIELIEELLVTLRGRVQAAQLEL